MRYEVRITAYDMFDQIHISWRLWETDTTGFHPPELVTTGVDCLAGEGESDPHRWLRNIAIALAESL